MAGRWTAIARECRIAFAIGLPSRPPRHRRHARRPTARVGLAATARSPPHATRRLDNARARKDPYGSRPTGREALAVRLESAPGCRRSSPGAAPKHPSRLVSQFGLDAVAPPPSPGIRPQITSFGRRCRGLLGKKRIASPIVKSTPNTSCRRPVCPSVRIRAGPTAPPRTARMGAATNGNASRASRVSGLTTAVPIANANGTSSKAT
jgi:hypothetical protein